MAFLRRAGCRIALHFLKRIPGHRVFASCQTIDRLLLTSKLLRHFFQKRLLFLLAHPHELFLVIGMEARHFKRSGLDGDILLWVLGLWGPRCSFSGELGFAGSSGSFLCFLCRLGCFGEFFCLMRTFANPGCRSCTLCHTNCAFGDLANAGDHLATRDHARRSDPRFNVVALGGIDGRINRTRDDRQAWNETGHAQHAVHPRTRLLPKRFLGRSLCLDGCVGAATVRLDVRERPVSLFEDDAFGRHDTASRVLSTGSQGKSLNSSQA